MSEPNETNADTPAHQRPEPGIVPCITTEERVRGGHGAHTEAPVTDPLAADLVVAYVADTGSGRLVTGADLVALGLGASELMDRALANLTDDLSEIQLGEHSHLMMVQTGGELEACTLLLAGLWDQLAEQLDGEVAVGAPSTDLVLIGDTASAAAMDELRRAVPHLHDPNAANALSPQLFVWRDGAWQVLANH